LPQLPLRWAGKKTTRHDYAAICDIPLDISRDELNRRIEVFGDDPNFGSRSNFAGTA
jgi:methionyl-tRNA formyltransferase